MVGNLMFPFPSSPYFTDTVLDTGFDKYLQMAASAQYEETVTSPNKLIN